MNDLSLPLESEAVSLCDQCGEAFQPREGSGGSKQRFCSKQCRLDFHGSSQRSAPHAGITEPPAPPPAAEKTPTSDVPKAAVREDGEFDWNTDESIVLGEQLETAIYFNERGGLVIRQRNWPDEDHYVVIAESNIGHFLDQLTDICGVPSVGK
jgi:hypothetical protein